MSLIDDIKQFKHQGKFDEFNYYDLCFLISKGLFFNYIKTANDLHEFINALSQKFCAINNYVAPQINFNELSNFFTFAHTEFDLANLQNKPSITINTSIFKMFDIMKLNNNQFYPYIVFESVIHEHCHVLQLDAIRTNNFDSLNDENKISALNLKMENLIKQAVIDGKVSIDKEINPELAHVLWLEMLQNSLLNTVFTFFNYGNSPHEIAARDFALCECEKLETLPGLTDFEKNRINCFVNYSKFNAFSLLFDSQYNNYDFMENLKRSQLFTAQPEILEIRKKIVSIIDKNFSKNGLLTVKEVEQMHSYIKFCTEVEFLKTRVGIDMNEQEFLQRVSQLEQKADHEQYLLESKLKKQYLYLFEKSAELKNFVLPKSVIYQPDICFFVKASEQLKQKGK